MQVKIDFNTGIIEGCRVTIRRLSDMAEFYSDQVSVNNMLKKNRDPCIYEIYEYSNPADEGNLNFGTTIIYPGKVGNEFYMTKGHYHQKNAGEVYQGLRGNGILLLQNRKGEFRNIEMGKGSLVYIPPEWAHRSVNIGDELFIYYFVYPSNSGHDYETIRRTGFMKLVVEKNSKPCIIDNIKYTPSES